LAGRRYFFFFLDFFAPPSIEMLASTSFSAAWSFFLSLVSNFCSDFLSLSLNEVPLVNLMKPITLPRFENDRAKRDAGIMLRAGGQIIKM
jgi:hypothetical protein